MRTDEMRAYLWGKIREDSDKANERIARGGIISQEINNHFRRVAPLLDQLRKIDEAEKAITEEES